VSSFVGKLQYNVSSSGLQVPKESGATWPADKVVYKQLTPLFPFGPLEIFAKGYNPFFFDSSSMTTLEFS
jgi:hypothetical protein